ILVLNHESSPPPFPTTPTPSPLAIRPANPDNLSPLLLRSVGTYYDAGSTQRYAELLQRELDLQIAARDARVKAMIIRIRQLDADAAAVNKKLEDLNNVHTPLERAIRQAE